MKTAIAKPLSVIIIIISFIVLFLSDGMTEPISAFTLVVGTVMLLVTTVIEIAGGW